MKNFVSAGILLLCSQIVTAGIINFEDTAPTNWYQPVIQSGGFQFDKNDGWMGVNDYSSWLPVGAFNATMDLDMGYGTFDMYQLSGESFDLHALDAGLSWYNYDEFDSLTITGYQSSGNIISTDLMLSHSYQSYTLDHFVDLEFITFSGNALNYGYAVIDNLDVSVASVPEPMMLPLFTIGFMGIMLSLRRRKSTCT